MKIRYGKICGLSITGAMLHYYSHHVSKVDIPPYITKSYYGE